MNKKELEEIKANLRQMAVKKGYVGCSVIPLSDAINMLNTIYPKTKNKE